MTRFSVKVEDHELVIVKEGPHKAMRIVSARRVD